MDHSLDQFSPLVNTSFILRDENGIDCEAVLVEAVARTRSGGSDSKVPFSLLFRVALDDIPAAAARQGTYQLARESWSPVSLFLVPIDADDAGVYFEAVFN